MTRNELLLHLRNCEKLNNRRKLKRFVLTVLFYTAVLLVICYWQDQLKGDIWNILSIILLCLIFAIASMLVNSIIFEQLLRLNKEEDEALEYLRKRLREKDQEETQRK